VTEEESNSRKGKTNDGIIYFPLSAVTDDGKERN